MWLLENITRDLDSIAEALFVEDVTDVVLNRTHTNLQFGCDFFVSQTARNGDGHAVFRVSQHFILKTYGSVVDFSGTDQSCDLRMSSFHALENRTYNCNQFIGLEGLGQIRVDAGTESFDAIGRLVFRGEKHYRDQCGSGRAAQLSGEFVTVHAGHANVADNEIRH